MEDIGVDGKIILRCIFTECGYGDIGWIDLSQDKDIWRLYELPGSIKNGKCLDQLRTG
jgi:hypothetical protein